MGYFLMKESVATSSRCISLSVALALIASANDRNRIWHERLGDLNFRSMKLMVKLNMVRGLPRMVTSKSVCEGCVLGMDHQEKFEKGKSWRAKTLLQMLSHIT
jgi:hypothetical protein